MRNARRLPVFLGSWLACLFVAPISSSQVGDWREIRTPTLRAFNPPVPKRVDLPNGLTLFIQEDHELPLIRGGIAFRGGRIAEPLNRAGLVQVFGEVWRTGGTKTRTGDLLDDYLETRAATVESGGWRDATSLNFDCLKQNFDDVFNVFLELLFEPEFREDKIVLAKNRLNTQISRRNENPQLIASRESSKLVYGVDSPYSRSAEYSTVAFLQRDELLKWYRLHILPNNGVLEILGDFDSAKMEARLRGAFSGWHRGAAASRPDLKFQPPKPGIYLVQKNDVTQSTVELAGLGTTMADSDYYAIEVFNEFFAGDMSSRLFSNIRSKRGIAYSVGGGIGAEYDHPGLVNLHLATRSENTVAAIEAFLGEIDALKSNPIKPQELISVKNAILNSFVFRFDSKEKVIRARTDYEFYHYPSDFLEKYRTGIERVAESDIARIAQTYLQKDRLVLLVIGKSADFDRPLSSLGPVTALDISIPPSQGTEKSN